MSERISSGKESLETVPSGEVDGSRRSLALALLGAIGGSALLKGCAEPGALDEAVEPYDPELPSVGSAQQALVSSSNIVRVGTMAELATAAGAAEYIAILGGFATPGDGGGGVFVWSATPLLHDGGTIVNSTTGAPAAGWRRIYSGSLSAKWFGATGNGTTDDTAALQAAINVAINNPNNGLQRCGRTLYLPPGVYRVTNTLSIFDACGFELAGEGASGRASVLRWAGPATAAVIEVDGAANAVRRIGINPVSKALAGIKVFNKTTGNNWVTTGNVFEDIQFSDASTNVFDYCVTMTTDGAGSTGNNELHRFIRCRFNGYITSAVHIKGGQSHAHHFVDCDMWGNLTAPYGVYCEYGSYIHWEGGSGGAHKEYDFCFNDFYTLSTIKGWNTEHSARFLRMASASGAPFPVNVTGCRIEHADKLAADEKSIHCGNAGPLTLSSNYFGASNGRPKILVHGYPIQRVINLIGNVFRGSTDYPRARITGALMPFQQGCLEWGGYVAHLLDAGNLYWENVTQGFNHIALATTLNIAGLGAAFSGEAGRNFMGTYSFVSGGVVAQVFFGPNGQEETSDYRIMTSVEQVSGTVPAGLTVKIHSKTNTSFKIELSQPAIGFAADVHWMLIRK